MKRPLIIGVMGGGSAAAEDMDAAYVLGKLIAEHGWILLNGGRNVGIMEASARGAFEKGGTTVGIVPDEDDHQTSEYINIPILTGMGNARNCINVLSSNVVIACAGGTGTISEIALALKCRKPVILLNFDIGKLFEPYAKKGALFLVSSPDEAVAKIREIMRA